jgi:hypothetical protein
MASFMSHDAAHGALPTLRAASAVDATPGSYYTPGRMLHLKGNPILIAPSRPARNAEAARRLSDLAEQLTGVQWPSLSYKKRRHIIDRCASARPPLRPR